MSLRRTLAFLALLTLAAASPARAVCTAADIAGLEGAGCAPGGATCIIAKPHTIDNGCTLDFSTQTLVVNAHLTIGSGTVTIRAAAVTISGLIDGIGSANSASGGMVMIETSGNVTVPQQGVINVQGNSGGGDVVVRAGGSVSIDGKVQADFLTAAAGGGLIDISAGGDITTGTTSTLSAQGGSNSDGGGEIDLTAGGALTLQNNKSSNLNVNGFCGGVLQLQAGAQVTMQGADASGNGDAGSGGCVDVTAGANTAVLGTITADGVGGIPASDGGGCGGFICLDGGLGDVTVHAGALVSADGGPDDGGGGGDVTLMARGNAVINGAITARGPPGSETCGGNVCVETGFDVTVAATGSLDLSGGCDGGELEFDAGRDLILNGPTDVSGTAGGSLGGDVAAYAGLLGSGSLMLTSTIDVSSAASCSVANGCGAGGTTDLQGCNLTLTSSSVVNASGPDAGENDLTAREQLTVQGSVNAANTVPPGPPQNGMVGTNYFLYPARKPPILGNGVVPTPDEVPATTCPEQGQTAPPCLNPCPVCGNGVVEFPETCDHGVVPPQSCSGCSVYCQIEDCDDGLVCTGDSCNPTYGCVNQPTPNCIEPTATASATATGTASVTPTATSTPTPSLTGTVTATSTGTVTATPTGTTIATPTGTVTATPTGTATTPPTATATVTQTPSPDPTATAPPACAGDCDGNGIVTVNELIVGVNIVLGVTSRDACPAFDRDGNGQVTISELIAAVNAALNGC